MEIQLYLFAVFVVALLFLLTSFLYAIANVLLFLYPLPQKVLKATKAYTLRPTSKQGPEKQPQSLRSEVAIKKLTP